MELHGLGAPKISVCTCYTNPSNWLTQQTRGTTEYIYQNCNCCNQVYFKGYQFKKKTAEYFIQDPIQAIDTYFYIVWGFNAFCLYQSFSKIH